MSKTDIRHASSSDSPLTIRSLYEVAVRQNWDLDTPLVYSNDELMVNMIVRGADPAGDAPFDGIHASWAARRRVGAQDRGRLPGIQEPASLDRAPQGSWWEGLTARYGCWSTYLATA